MRNSFLAVLAIGAMAGPSLAMELTSPDIVDGKPLPIELNYTRCGGSNISPALVWSGAPAGTKSFVLTVIDTSVKPLGWSHWIVMQIPPGAHAFAKGIAKLPNGSVVVKSNFGDYFYDGPCPPAGSGLHRYEFTIWALGSKDIQLKPDAPADEISAALTKKALGKATLTGTVER